MATPPPVPAMLVPTETGYRQHKGPTITMPSSLLRDTGTVDLTAEAAPKRLWASTMDINTCKAGWTPLCAAVQQGKIESVKQLLSLGADPNIPNGFGAHPIFYALRNWALRIFRLLVKHGADIQRARSERGELLQDYAKRKVQQAAQLRAFGAAYFSTASRQELLNAVGAKSAAQTALDALAQERARKRQKTQRGEGGRSPWSLPRRGPPQRHPAHEDPYGGSVAFDLTDEPVALQQEEDSPRTEDREDLLDDAQIGDMLASFMETPDGAGSLPDECQDPPASDAEQPVQESTIS
mmetsp:Transcript_30088/g.67697  ORF Transcript_30088/g.67697 Transcript_30088/m.67697 type:complete len:295 (-) Transcript_30088:27-911(-)